jgi:hypothetical protein
VRPTVEGLGHATDCLEGLAWRCTANNDNGYHRAADLVDLLAWLDTELEQNGREAAYPPGTDTHTIGRHGLNRPTEGRLEWGTEDPYSRHQRGGVGQPPVEPNDPVYKRLRKLQRDINAALTSQLAQWHYQAEEAGGYPKRTQTG